MHFISTEALVRRTGSTDHAAPSLESEATRPEGIMLDCCDARFFSHAIPSSCNWSQLVSARLTTKVERLEWFPRL